MPDVGKQMMIKAIAGIALSKAKPGVNMMARRG
jgi:hypothetical protein